MAQAVARTIILALAIGIALALAIWLILAWPYLPGVPGGAESVVRP